MASEHDRESASPTGESESDATPFDTCAHCGTAFEPGVRYPVATWDDADGNLQLVSFCDEDCREAWEQTRAE